ncbi:hypothetical protein RhiirA4_539794 [Rhizophagus irregularis]|uniref:Uncharacterized protein n=1 Tax=Rhizophagus irregularis TaxID=588596 RepID=A0A2I1G4X2_9GLOM|nr:hypothetical protein RhiirA4_539794 [Rhizophagus irregularis]
MISRQKFTEIIAFTQKSKASKSKAPIKKLSDAITAVVSSKPRNYWQNISGNQNLLKDLDNGSNLMASLLTTGISKTSLYKYCTSD